eukprot:14170240-Alexandrium_andersonii.AAC.1
MRRPVCPRGPVRPPTAPCGPVRPPCRFLPHPAESINLSQPPSVALDFLQLLAKSITHHSALGR